MPRVVVDLEALRIRNCGLGQFSLHLGSALLKRRSDDLQLTYFLRTADAAAFDDPALSILPAREWRREQFCKRLRPLVRRIVREPACDVWHMANQFARFWPLDPRTPMLLTIHDLNFLREFTPVEIQREFVKLQAKVDRASLIAADSQFVAGEIREHLRLRGKEVEVVYCGVEAASPTEAERPAWAPAGKFLFTIGEVCAKKNFHVLLDLIARLPQHALVIAGNKASDYAQALERDAVDRQLSQRVVLPGQITNRQRNWLYHHCEAFVFPSKTEGFGLPVVEAMAAGRPVFISHATSLPEVGGDLAFYWHAFTPEHLWQVFADGMRKFASQSDYSDRLRQRAAEFSWAATAQQYESLYRRLAGLRRAAA